MANYKKTTPWNKIKAEYLQGATPKQLAEKYELTAKSITNKASSEKWTSERKTISDNLRQNTQDKINDLTNLALDVLADVLKDNEVRACDKIAAVKAVFDISGLKNIKPETKRELPVININGVKI
ncbi:MAG: hypothetical protein NC408_04405 [Candidatus Gastranaerophilales bacterium]|nr:hypothetical protein [Candidatus Gastranaerophilales bacterium]MCM1072287.1 hypothetical protein [Bacteroides sp.]